ncbi:MAG: hypothetical protein FWC20_06895 [Oscillospiraceae bacterium]|nr:hypothetical protein [Oscillospiraceae bacterium]MCL2279118.1 hypothetical protein [Oscillospiraceae bacterium]
MKKSKFSIVLIILSLLFIVACSSNNGEPSQESGRVIWDDSLDDHISSGSNIVGLPVGEYTYLRSYFQIEENIIRIPLITVHDGTIYGAAVMGYASDFDAFRFFSIDSEANEVFLYPRLTNFTWGEFNSISGIAANGGGNIYFISNEHFSGGDGITQVTSHLTQIDTAGNVIFSVDISEHFEDVHHIFGLAVDDAGNIYLQQNSGDILLFNAAGIYKFTASIADFGWSGPAGDPFLGADRTMLFPIWTYTEGDKLFTIDLESHGMLSYQSLPSARRFATGLRGNKILMLTDAGVYHYCLETSGQERHFHWLEVGMTFTDSVFSVRDGQFALLDRGDITQPPPTAVTFLTRTAVEEDTRSIVTLASFHPDYMLIRDFNAQSPDYRIAVIDFSEFVVDFDTSAAMARFNIEMIAGRVPDVFDLTFLDYRVLANGGFLADLNPWLEQDSRICRSDFVERVFELMEVDGSLYALTPGFGISTSFAPSSLVGASPGITLEQLMLLEEQWDDGNPLILSSPQWFLSNYWSANRSVFIDYEAGTANFESDAFLRALEYAGRLGQNVHDFYFIGDQFFFELEVRRGNLFIKDSVFITNPGLQSTMEAVAGTELTAIGFPSTHGVGSFMFPSELYAMGYGAQNPSGAWEFLRFMLAEKENAGPIPVARAALGAKIDEAMRPVDPYCLHQGGGMYIGGVFIEFNPMTQAQADRFMEVVETLGVIYLSGDSDEIIRNIILEEAEVFFRGSRSAENTARVIQSRVQVYVWER